MIHEPKNINFQTAYEQQEYKDNGGSVSCGHSDFFWNTVKNIAEFGDTIYCESCRQYFVMAKDLPWVTKKSYFHINFKDDTFETTTPIFGTNHLSTFKKGERVDKWLYPINIRITD